MAACANDGSKVTSQGTTTTAASSGTTTTTSACSVSGVDPGSKSAGGTGANVLLTDVRTGRQPCADRVVFDFRNGRPPYTVEYQPGPTFALGESDQTITVEGSAFLVVRVEHAAGVDLSDPSAPQTYTGPESIHPNGLTHVREIRRTEDFEGVLIWVIGVDATRPFSVGVLDGPSRVYVDIA